MCIAQQHAFLRLGLGTRKSLTSQVNHKTGPTVNHKTGPSENGNGSVPVYGIKVVHTQTSQQMSPTMEDPLGGQRALKNDITTYVFNRYSNLRL